MTRFRRPSARRRDPNRARVDSLFGELEPRCLLAADAVTDNNPLWIAARTSEVITIDGQLNEAAWASAIPIERTLASLPSCGVSLKILYTSNGLKIGAEIRDPYLYADGDGRGAQRGQPWDYFNDDALALYFDVKEGRSATAMPTSGRVLAFNAAQFNSRTSGTGALWRRNFMRGDPASPFGLSFINPDGSPPAGLTWNVQIDGTRNNSRSDQGWTAEINIPWSALGLKRAPADGRTMGMNFQVFFDNNGGKIEYGDVPDFAANERYDAKLTAVPSSYDLDPRNGWPRPVGYAALQFADANANHQPATISDLTAQAVSAHGALLDFVAPAGTLARARLNKGHASAYQIRLSNAPITDQTAWEQAVVVENSFTPKLRGQHESLRIGNLAAGTTYHIAVRAVDSTGHRFGALGASAALTTFTSEQDPSNGERIIVSPDGATLVTEYLQPFPIIGGTAGIHNLYIRGLYSGGVWSGANATTPTDFSLPNNHQEGEASDYFAALAASGVNTLRLQLEWLVRPSGMNTGTKRARFDAALPDGIRWLEWRDQGSSTVRYNEQMHEFLHQAINAAHAAGIRFVMQTSNNFNYADFFELTTFAKSRGGPLDSIDQLFDETEAGLAGRQLVKDRLKKLADWIRDSEHPETVIGLELYNEWDGGIKDPARPAGFSDNQYNTLKADNRRAQIIKRATFLKDVSHDIRGYAPELLVFGAVIGTEPDGPLARSLFYSDTFDVLDPHLYTPAVSQPVYNTEADKSVRVARDYGAIAAYWLTSRRDNRPIHNGEWDITGVGNAWPSNDREHGAYYTDHPAKRNLSGLQSFTLAEDEANYRVASWTNIASGLAGAGWRIGSGPTDDFTRNETLPPGTIRTVPLTRNMRATQQAISSFFAGDTLGFNWASFRPHTLSGHITTTAATAGHRFVSVGSTDGEKGLAYILHDLANPAPVTDATLSIDSLAPGLEFTFELWSTDAAASPFQTIVAQADANGRVSVSLPEFARDVVVRFCRTAHAL